jgi:hypothetical protein
MQTIKLKLTVSEDRNPYLVDENDDVVVKSCNIGWVINNDGRLVNASPNFITSNLNKMVNVQVHSYGKPVMLNDKVIIKL